VLGVDRRTPLAAIRARWKLLVRENHPDTLASQGMPPAQIAAASDRVARINAAYDSIKRDFPTT
jgi:DnaJ like chaperone protein